MANTTFSGPVISTNGFVGSVTGSVSGAVSLPAYTVATAPAVGAAGTIIYVSDGNAGAPTVAVSNGTNWIAASGIAIAAA